MSQYLVSRLLGKIGFRGTGLWETKLGSMTAGLWGQEPGVKSHAISDTESGQTF